MPKTLFERMTEIARGVPPRMSRCKAPGCNSLTDRDICERCNAWVDEQVAALDREERP